MPDRTVLKHPPHLPLVAPSILAADFARLAEDCDASIRAGADLLHLDVMDGHFVPNLTMGPALCGALRETLPDVCLDVHLMVTDPAAFVKPFVDAGADHLTFHIEVVPDPAPLARVIQDHGLTAGLAINPPTDVQSIVPHLEHFEMILVMSVNPGFGGQAFMGDVLEKVRIVRKHIRDDQRLEMDGGVGPITAQACRDAGCDVLVAGSAVFGKEDYTAAIESVRGNVTTASRNS